MSTDYNLDLFDRTQSLDYLAIREALLVAFPLQTEDDFFFHDPEANLGVVVTVHSDPSGLAERKALGFPHAGVYIGFTLQGDYDDETMSEMIRMVNWVLERYSVDAAFSNPEYANPRLFRSKGKIVLADGEEFWSYDPVLRTLITLPHEYCKTSVYFNLTFYGTDRKIHPMALANLLLAKFHLSVHPHDAPRRICEGLIITPHRFDGKHPTAFAEPHDHGENLGINFEVDVLSYDVGLAKLVAITRWVLDQYANEATLEWHPESGVRAPLLTRTNNEITLADEPDFWTPERKAIFSGKP